MITNVAPTVGVTVALIPAHNEAAGIGAAVASVRGQVASVVVLCDNCTDNTAALARAAGAVTFDTAGNTAKKAGALNQGLDLILPLLAAADTVLVMDADSTLCPDWVARATAKLTDAEGAVSGAYFCRPARKFVALLQNIEYAQERRRVARRHGRVDVLSGVATLFQVAALRRLDRLKVYDESSLTEDFEITLALQSLDYRPSCPRDCLVQTDVMESWAELFAQRFRWQRGTIETLRAYGWTPVTRRLWCLQVFTYLRTLIFPAAVALNLGADLLAGRIGFSPWWLLVLPIICLEQFVSSRRAGATKAALAASILPGLGYDLFRSYVYWRALFAAIRGGNSVWTVGGEKTCMEPLLG